MACINIIIITIIAIITSFMFITIIIIHITILTSLSLLSLLLLLLLLLLVVLLSLLLLLLLLLLYFREVLPGSPPNLRKPVFLFMLLELGAWVCYTPGQHNKNPRHKIFAKGCVAQKQIFERYLDGCAKIFQGFPRVGSGKTRIS